MPQKAFSCAVRSGNGDDLSLCVSPFFSVDKLLQGILWREFGRSGLPRAISQMCEAGKPAALDRGRVTMRAPYGLNILDNCMTCPAKGEHLFCNLSLQAGQRLNEIKSTAVYPKGAMLFIEGQIARGVFVLCSGKVKLSTTSREGKTIITKISDAGDVLGLNAVISNVPYEVTAEMMEPGQANFIPRDSLQLFLKEFPEVSMRVAQQLSKNYYCAYEEIRTLGLAASPSEKFAKLLLTWSTKSNQSDGSSQVKLTLTHEEIAEIIGTTRETVSRLFSEFKKKQLMQAKGATLVIRSRFALEKIVQSY
jgi:CRP/FNR family transcriptional regulator